MLNQKRLKPYFLALLMQSPLLALVRAGEGGESCACDLTEPLGLSQPTVSHHLKVLTEAGLLVREQRGTWAWFRVVPERLAEIGAVFA